jgi:D-xylonolactonase
MFRLEVLASGYGLIEGPRVDPEDNLYFSDVLGGGVYRRSPSGEITTVVPKRRGVGGIALHADGGLIISGRNICHVKDGTTRVVFDLEDTPGYNDLFTNARGQVLVGSMRTNPFGAPGPREPGELYLITAEDKATQLYNDVSLTNGIGFSPDGRTLYHSDTARNQVIVHDVDEVGQVANRRSLGDTPDLQPDGLAVDEAGCVWIADYGAGCARRVRPDGRLDLTIDLPSAQVTSLCFGGSDLRDLYIVTADNTDDPDLGGTIFRTRVNTPGLAVALASI